MPATLEPIKAIKCTYKDCVASFDTEKEMKAHKKNSEIHDYCSKCDEDCDSFDDLAMHKAMRPDKHGKACRICGHEFKSASGLKRHIELCHHVDQKLPCLGCGEKFHRACLLIEHLEFGECRKITAMEFQGCVVHKYLIAELLKGGRNYDRFMQKISKFDAAIDGEEDGGINLIDQDDEDVHNSKFPSITPEISEIVTLSSKNMGSYPPLPSQAGSRTALDTELDLTDRFRRVSIGAESESAVTSSSVVANSSYLSATSQLVQKTEKAWSGGHSVASSLFSNSKPTPIVSEWSAEGYEKKMEQDQGINILTTRFWDPVSRDWNPERFYNPVTMKYYCPFVCEQDYDIAADLNRHIMRDHRITKHKCPYCLKSFKSTTALVAHCESRSMRCQINKSDDFGTFLDRITGGFLAVEEKIRPDHLHNPAHMIYNEATGRMEKYRAPAAVYQQYNSTKPVDWKDEEKTVTVGGGAGKSVMMQGGGYLN